MAATIKAAKRAVRKSDDELLFETTGHETFATWLSALSELAPIDHIDREQLRDAFYDKRMTPARAVDEFGLVVLKGGPKPPRKASSPVFWICRGCGGRVDATSESCSACGGKEQYSPRRGDLPETEDEAAEKAAAIDVNQNGRSGDETSRSVNKKGPKADQTGPSVNNPGRIQTVELAVNLIDPSPLNPRQEFDKDELKLLGQSLLEKQIEPIAVRVSKATGRYELLWGERRFRAAKLVKKLTLRAEIHECTDQEAMFLRGEENERRQAFNPVEQATWYQQLLDSGMTQRQLAEKVGCEQPKIALAVGLLKLPESWQRRVIAQEITPTHTRALLAWKDRPTVLAEAEKEFKRRNQGRGDDPLSAREFEALVAGVVLEVGRSMRAPYYPGDSGCYFTPTNEQREQLDIVEVKRYSQTEKVAFNVKLWDDLNNAAKSKKLKAQREKKPQSSGSTSSRQPVQGPGIYTINDRIRKIFGPPIAASLKKTDFDLALRIVLMGEIDGSIAHVITNGKQSHVDDPKKWQWIQTHDLKSLQASVVDVAKAVLTGAKYDSIEIEHSVLVAIAKQQGLDPLKDWKPTKEDLDIFPIEFLKKMPAAKRCAKLPSTKGEIVSALLAAWTPGELPPEFAKALGKKAGK